MVSDDAGFMGESSRIAVPYIHSSFSSLPLLLKQPLKNRNRTGSRLCRIAIFKVTSLLARRESNHNDNHF
jgi:hypothetical protein